jgi:sigma-B regulation protein RsbU (phosphoserine phosphatase)
LYFNGAARKMLGIGPEEDVHGMTIAETHPPRAYRVVAEEGLPAAIRDGTWAGETVLLSRSGHEIPVSQVIVAHKAPDGSLEYLSTIMRDISERKQAEDQLRQLSSAVEQSPASVVITDIDGHIQFVNATFVATTGYRMEEVLGKKPSLLKSGMTPPETYRAMWDTLLEGKIWRGELQNRKKSGELYWERTALAPIRMRRAKSPVVAVEDTERKRMEQALRDSEGRLRPS